MKIVNETELMTNHKSSTIVVPDKQFEALQTIEGNSLLFSIGSDNILYCTREVPGDTHGWLRVDLSTPLSAALFNGAPVIAKTFDIAQDLGMANAIDIALVVTANGQDHLLLAQGFDNTLDNWAASLPSFAAYPFDDPAQPQLASHSINDVQIVDGNGCQYIIADIISNVETNTISRYYIDPSQSAYINPDTGASYTWVPHRLPLDLQTGNITTLLGCGPNDGPDGSNTGGTYLLGSVNGAGQLAYIPTYNFVDVFSTPAPTIFGLPAGYDSSHMAIALSIPADNAPYTDLFFASNYTDSQGKVQGGLYFLSNNNQVNKGTGNPVPALIYSNDLLKNIQSLRVENWNDNIVIWGQSQYLDTDTNTTVSRLFIMEGIAGQEINITAWSCPITLLLNVENSSAYVNNKYSLDSAIDQVNGNAYGSCSILFAHQADGSLVQLFQDPVTTAWQQRSLLVVPNTITEVYETTTYSTNIEITDDNNQSQPNLPVYIWSSSPCAVYISDANNTAGYHTLEFDKPAKFETDFSGNITLMQPVDAIGGIAFNIAVQDPATSQWYTKAINPMAVSIANLKKQIPDGKSDYLQNAQVTDEYDNKTPLISSANSSQTTSSSNQIYTISQQNSAMNQDGLTSDQVAAGGWPNPASAVQALQATKAAVKPAPTQDIKPASKGNRRHYIAPIKRTKKFAKADRQFKNLRFNSKTDKIWAWTFGENAKHYEGIEAVKAVGITLNADGSLALNSAAGLGGIFSHIEAKLGHVAKWIKSEAHKLEQVVITVVGGGVDFLISIAGEIYHFIAKCATDIVNMVHTVLNAIEAAFKDVVAWIGMIFSFKDILRTHEVMKNILTVYFNNCVQNISTLSGDISTAFSNLENQIDKKTGLPTSGIPDAASIQTYQGGMASGQAPSGSKSPSANYGAQHFKNNSKSAQSSDSPASSITEDIFNDLLQLIQNEGTAFSDAAEQIKTIASNIRSQPAPETITQLMAVVVDLLLNTAENLLQELVVILDQLLSGVMDALNYTIHIPVITYMYKKMTKSDEKPDGDDLTALDLGCLISSFFSTVVYKVVKGNAPFPEGNLTDAIVNAQDLTSLQQAISNFETGGVSITPGMLGHEDNNGMTTLDIISSIDAMMGALLIDLSTIVKSALPNVQVPTDADSRINMIFTMFNSVGYWAYIFPDVVSAVKTWNMKTQPWYTDMNNLCTYLGVTKSLVDFTSWKWAEKTYGKYVGPTLDFVLNVAWQVPTVAQLVVDLEGQPRNTYVNAIVSFVGGTAFDLSGMLSLPLGFAYYADDTPGRSTDLAWLVGGISVCNLIWGGACLITTFDQLPVPS